MLDVQLIQIFMLIGIVALGLIVWLGRRKAVHRLETLHSELIRDAEYWRGYANGQQDLRNR